VRVVKKIMKRIRVRRLVIKRVTKKSQTIEYYPI